MTDRRSRPATLPGIQPDARHLPSEADASPWSWEGNVQTTVADYLRREGWSVSHEANTASHERGKEIEAECAGIPLWVTVKGFPAGTDRTSPNTQARHWFTAALFDVILWRNQNHEAQIAVALPAMQTYKRLAARATWFQTAAKYSYLWVTETGAVIASPPE